MITKGIIAVQKSKTPANPAMIKSGVFVSRLSGTPPGIADRYMIGGQDLNLIGLSAAKPT